MKVAYLCIQRPKKVPSKLSGARNVLLDSLKVILETLTEAPLLMHTETWNSVYGYSNAYVEHSWHQRNQLTPARNPRRPLRLLGGRFGDTLEKHHFWCTYRLQFRFMASSMHMLNIHHVNETNWHQPGTPYVLVDSLEDDLETPWRSTTSGAHTDFKFGLWHLQCICWTFITSMKQIDTSQEPQTSS